MGPRVTQPLHLVPNLWDDEPTTIWRPTPPAQTPTPAPVLTPALAPRRWPRRLAIAALLLAVLIPSALHGARAYAAHLVRTRALPALAARLDLRVTAGDIDVTTDTATIRDLAIGELATIDRLVVRFTIVDLFDRRVRIDRIDAHGLTARVEPADLDRLRNRSKKSAGDSTTGAAVDLSRAALAGHELTIIATDPTRGVTATFELDHLAPAGAGAVAIDGAAIAVSGGDTDLGRLLAANPVAGVSGTLSRDRFDLAGHFAGDPGQTWRAAGSRAELRLGGKSISLDRILAALELVSDRRAETLPLASTGETTIGGELTLALDADTISARGTIDVSDLAVADRRLARTPVDRISGSLAVAASVTRDNNSLQIDEAIWRPRAAPDVSYRLTASARRNPRRLAARLEIPETSCAALLASLPPALVPELAGFELGGRFSAVINVAIDWSDLDDTVLDGSIGIDGCQVLAAPSRMSAERLRGSFEHTVPVGNGETRTYVIGPENPDFVPLSQVSRNLIRSLLTTEDGSFFRHDGFRVSQFRTALIKNLERGRFAYGASSITMQMVKNVLLRRDKTLSRKLQELFLTWYVEGGLSKKRILEIYLNAIEFGPGLYGIKPAARQYFGKHPRRLNPVESAFFSSILPAPRRRFRQYCRGYAGRWTLDKMDRIIDRMFDQSRLDPEQYLAAIETPLVFRGKRRRLCKGVK